MIRDRNIALRPPGEAPAPAQVAEQDSAQAPAQDSAQVAEQVGEVLAGVLRTEPDRLDPEQTFRLLGVDSMLSVEFVALVNARFGTDFRATELYDHPTPSAFARHVAAVTGGAMAEPSVPLFPQAASAAPAAGDPGAGVLETLREQLAEILYCDAWDIDADAPFSSLGLDSILAVEFVACLNHAYGMEEKAEVLYDRPNLTALAAYVCTRTATVSEPAAPLSLEPTPVTPTEAGDSSAADGSAGLEALLGAVRDGRVTVEQALTLLPQHS
ncbi:acyl carrier protein [Streptomyces sp. NPDC048442]|uniref:acyl carrier protein n=1 Tax=Streptomyces sp. NPDC048442 TaxID=3154823 RepID=UPI00344678BB